jgi:predicted dehydrogenase/ABC-type glycerol-3-phosphate transport system substrate-binding protein
MPDISEKFTIAVRKFGPFESAMQKFWTAFCLHTGCTLALEMVVMDLHELHQRTLTDDGLKNGVFDIAHLNTDWIDEAYALGAVEVLNPYISNNPPEDYPQGWSNSLLELQQFDGETVGLPFHDGPECLIYRKDLFENEQERQDFRHKFGKELKVPKTWEDFYQVAQFFYRPEANLYGSIFAGYPDGHNAVFDYCLQLWTRGGNLLDQNGNIDIDTPASLESLSFYRQIINDHTAVHPKSAEFDSVAAGIAFSRGEAAMMINWFGFAAMCEVEPNANIKGKVDVALLPSNNGQNTASLNVYWLYTIGSGSKHQSVAYDFLRFATTMVNDKLLTLEGGIGCRISTWKDVEINQIIPFYHKLEAIHQVARMLPQQSNWAEIAKVIDEMMQDTVHTDRDLSSILAHAQQKINSIINMDITYQPELPKTQQLIIIIGAGGIVADAHLPAYQIAGFKVHGIINRTRSRAEELAERFHIPNVYDSVAQAVAQAPANVVYDLTIMPEQYLETLAQLPDGSAVLIQKPMGDDFEQAKAILHLCRKKKLKAAINFQLRFAPFVTAARAMIEQGLIGEIYDMEVRVTIKTPWEIFPHVIVHPRLEIQYHSIHYVDLIRSFLGDPASVMAKTLKHPAKSLSSSRSTILFDYGDTIHAVINTNHDHEFGAKHQESFIKWEGTKGAIVAKMGLLMDYPKGVPDQFDYCILNEGKMPEWKTLELEGSWFPEAFIGTMANLMRYNEGSINKLYTSVEDVINTMAVVESAYQSSDEGGIRPSYSRGV